MNKFKNGDIFCGCKILCRCGRGASGVTWLAENPIGQKIIVKIIVRTDTSEREMNGLRRYMAVSGTHPNLLKIFHIGELDDSFYYTMEAADDLGSGAEYNAATLGNILRQGRRFTPDEATNIIRQLLAGVEAMHQSRLLHRDIKPDNIIFVNGIPKLSDPGLVVEQGEDSTFAGTPGFIPPELIERPLPPDCSSDLYALGKVFYCMTTGLSARKYPMFPEDMDPEVCRQLFPLICRMCDRNPRSRFSSAAEFAAGLPEKFPVPGRMAQWRREFRSWKILNQTLYHLICAGTALLLLCLTCGGFFIFRQQHKHKQNQLRLQQQITNFISQLDERRELLQLQLEADLPSIFKETRALDENLRHAAAAGDWLTAKVHKSKLKHLLQQGARQLQPKLPEVWRDFRQGFDLSGAAHSFLATPLADFIDTAAYRNALKIHDRKLLPGWSGPRCGQNWENIQYYYAPMIFVPAGAVRMDHNGKLHKIPYHFWMCKNEAIHEHFTRITGIAPQRSPHPNTPLERVCWNDILYYCRAITEIFSFSGVLPPGYIVRPPTDTEWEYAAKNGWLGADTTPFEKRAVYRSNSENRTWPPGTKLSNKLGLNDIYGNVSELVLPSEPLTQQHSVIMRGGSYTSSKKHCFQRRPYLAYQYLPFDIGFRLVIAPGDMSFFEQHFFSGGPAQARLNGKVYELVGANIGAFNWKRANEMSKLLGGRLAELETLEQFDFILKQLPLAGCGWGCFVGGRKINGQWRWLSSGKKIDYGKWRPSAVGQDGSNLIIQAKKWKGVDNYSSGIFLCEWDEKLYPQRNIQQQSGKPLPLEVARFSIGERKYILFQSSILFYSAARVCELLGGQLAVPDTPELQSELIKKLDKYKEYQILLGGYAKQKQWFWLNGKEIDFPLEKHPDVLIPSVNRNFVVLQNGRFYNSQFSSLFLCEWRSSSASLN